MAADAAHPDTPALMGELGLNTVPNARVDPVGTVRAQASTLDPYLNGSFGLQIAQPLYINIRQTAETSSLTGHATSLLPGIDFKALLLGENARRPAVALGLQSAEGDSRLAGEYLALSKRLEHFDFTGGLGWGRFASGGHLPNPLRFLFNHFGKSRPADAATANGPDDWFTGQNIGLFAGVAWDAPVRGLTLKADWGQDDFSAERMDDAGFKPARDWSLGFSYSPRDWVSFGAAVVGGTKIMGTVSFQGPLGGWPGRESRGDQLTEPFPAYRAGEATPQAIDTDAAGHGLYSESIMADSHTAATRYLVEPGDPLPIQLGEIVRPMAIHGGAETDAFTVQPAILGLTGPSVTMTRRDLEQDLARNDGSPQEIWRHVQFGPPVPDKRFPYDSAFMDHPHFFGLILDSKASLSEQDQGVLYRTGLIGTYLHMLTRHLITGQSLRLNVADNLKNLNALRPIDILPVRSDEDKFAQRRIALDRSYLSWMKSYRGDWHVAFTGGYLEEMYGGAGGEILYRPFGRTYAFGAEMWEALKRSPYVPLDTGFNGDHLLTGHIKAYYEVPQTDLTLEAKVGRYLAEDVGGTLSLTNRFHNGARLEAFVTATDLPDRNIYGGTTELYSGVRLRLPLGNLPLVPRGSEARLTVAPIGRDAGQSIDNPLPLYDLTEQVSYRHIADHWTDFGK